MLTTYNRKKDTGKTFLSNVFSKMFLIRIVEEQISEKYVEQEMRCPIHLSIGQEANAVGVCAYLEKEDQVLSAHRSHAHYLAKGGDLVKMLAELHGKKIGCAGGKGGSMHLFDLDAGLIAAVPIVGSTLPIGVGVAFGMKRTERRGIVVIFFGDGATEEGVFAESLDFAALKSLPVLFVCENNQYSVYTHLQDRQFKGRSIVEIGKAHGVQGQEGDGNNILEVLSNAKKAIEIVRSGTPYLLEFNTYRWLEHCGPNWDDHLGYRKEGELDHWMERCPIKSYEDYLLNYQDFSEQELSKLRTEIQGDVQLAFQEAATATFPAHHALFEDVYA
jgi:pyruvate dehydrogenase E1 component alpha subunit